MWEGDGKEGKVSSYKNYAILSEVQEHRALVLEWVLIAYVYVEKLKGTVFQE